VGIDPGWWVSAQGRRAVQKFKTAHWHEEFLKNVTVLSAYFEIRMNR
jgi:hypothetical protein